MRSRSFLMVVPVLFLIAAGAIAQVRTANTTTDNRDADRAAIKAHIESITQAFIDLDIDKIFSTHSEDWRGFLGNSQVPIKGVDEYMKANGIPWPWPKDQPKPKSDPSRGANGFTIKDFDVIFYSPDIGVANFILDFERREGEKVTTLNRYRILDVYAKRKGEWIQVASHTVVDPQWRQEQMGNATQLHPQSKEDLLKAREAVWRAFFSNDKAGLEKLLPSELIVMDGSSAGMSNRAEVFAGAQRFAENGGKLVRLEFPKTEMQVYANGSVAIIYTTYLYELEIGGARSTSTGRATEIFVRRGGAWVNSGWQMAASPKAQ